MIKVPATPEGVPAIRTLISEGINVNVTLLFARERVRGGGPRLSSRASRRARPRASHVGARRQRGQLLREPHRHASVDALHRGEAEDGRRARTRRARRPRAARWRSPTRSSPTRATRRSSPARAGRRSRAKGAQSQRVLWASTGTKNPQLQRRPLRRGADRPRHGQHRAAGHARAFRDHGRPRAEPRGGRRRRATASLDDLEKSGISLRKVTDDLLADGVKQVRRAVHEAARARSSAAAAKPTRRASTRRRYALPAAAAGEGRRAARRRWDAEGGTRRLFAGRRVAVDGHRRGELDRLDRHRRAAARRPEAAARPAARRSRKEGFTHVAAARHGRIEPLPRSAGRRPSAAIAGVAGAARPRLHRSGAGQGDRGQDRPRETLFIVSSKSGSTLEPNIFKAYFFDRVKQARRRRQGGQPLHRRHRSRLEPREGSAARRLPPHLRRA